MTLSTTYEATLQFQMEHEHHLVIQFVIGHELRLSQDAKTDRNVGKNHHGHSEMIFDIMRFSQCFYLMTHLQGNICSDIE